MEINFKKAVVQMLILLCLSKKNYSIYEINQIINTYSGNSLAVENFYVVIYRLEERGLIKKAEKIKGLGAKYRWTYTITEDGRIELERQIKEYRSLSTGVESMFAFYEGE